MDVSRIVRTQVSSEELTPNAELVQSELTRFHPR
jgi:hypothetical protein